MQQTQVQGQKSGEAQGQGKRRKWLFWVRLGSFIIALLLILVGAAIWILNSLGSMTNLFTTIFAILGVLFAFFALSNLFFPSNKPIIINVPPSPPPPPSTPPEKPAPRSIIGTPPPTDPRSIQQREKVVGEVYAKLTQPDMTAVVLTGIGGVGKSTLAALVYRYAEEQRRAGEELFAAEPLWLTVDATVTLADLAGTLFAALDKPMPDLGSLSLQNQATALFNALDAVDRTRLLVLDQFENLLDSRTGQALAERPGVGEWIDALNSQPCRCQVLLTSRLWPRGTREYPPTCMQEYHVGGLEVAEGVELLRKLGIEATETELRTAVVRCGGHGMSLTLLASIMRRNRSLSLASLFSNPIYAHLWQGEIARNLLDYIYTQQLDPLQRKLLLTISVYREPVPLEAAQALMNSNATEGIADALNVLLAQHLVQAPGKERYQLHAIVASYAQDHFVENDQSANRGALQAAHTGAAQYYLQLAASSCPPPDKRHGIDDVRPLIEAVWQLCQAGQWQEAYDLMQQEGIFTDLKRWGGNVILLELYQLLPLDKWHPEASQAARISHRLGWIYNDLGKKVEALNYYEQALNIWRETGDRGGEGTTLNNLGLVYDALGQKEQALRYYEQALGISREVGDRGGEGTTLNNLGGVYDDLGQKEQALRYYEQALGIYREVGDRGGEGTTLNNLGLVYNDLGQKEQALSYFEQALGISREVGDRGGEGSTLNNLGGVYNDLGQKEQALSYYEQALDILREVGDRSVEGTTLNNLGGVYNDLGQKEQALSYYEQALGIRREVGDRGGEGTTLNNLGRVYDDLGQKEQARRYYEQALGIRREVGDRGGEGTTLNNLGRVYDALGQKEQALRYYEQALGIRREVGDRGREGTTLNNLGAVYNALGQKEQALKYYEQALGILREVGNRSVEGTTLNNLGAVYDALGQKEQALRYYEQALGICREVGDRGGEGTTLNNLGGVYDALGQKEQALRYYEQALGIRREVGDRGGEGVTLHNIGTIYFEQERYNVALACFLLARDLFDEVQSPNRDVPQRYIDALKEGFGEEQFAELVRQVEPRAAQMVEQALREGL